MFNVAEQVFKKFPDFEPIANARHDAMREVCNYHNSNLSHLFTEMYYLRDQLPRLISEERVETEEKIRKILKQISDDKKYQSLKKAESEAEANFNNYIKSNFSLEDKVAIGIRPDCLEDWGYLFSEEEIKEYNKQQKEGESLGSILCFILGAVIITGLYIFLKTIAP